MSLDEGQLAERQNLAPLLSACQATSKMAPLVCIASALRVPVAQYRCSEPHHSTLLVLYNTCTLQMFCCAAIGHI